MRSRLFAALLLLAFIAPAWPVSASASPAGEDAYLGRWDITATGSQSGRPRNCWLELRRDDGVLKGRFNAGGGAVFNLPQVTIERGELKFNYPQGKPETQQVWQATLNGAPQWGDTFVERRARAGVACDSAAEKARKARRPLQW